MCKGSEESLKKYFLNNMVSNTDQDKDIIIIQGKKIEFLLYLSKQAFKMNNSVNHIKKETYLTSSGFTFKIRKHTR